MFMHKGPTTSEHQNEVITSQGFLEDILAGLLLGLRPSRGQADRATISSKHRLLCIITEIETCSVGWQRWYFNIAKPYIQSLFMCKWENVISDKGPCEASDEQCVTKSQQFHTAQYKRQQKGTSQAVTGGEKEKALKRNSRHSEDSVPLQNSQVQHLASKSICIQRTVVTARGRQYGPTTNIMHGRPKVCWIRNFSGSALG